MLALTRRLDEEIELRSPDGGLIAVVKVLDIVGGRVRLGVEAPKDIAIVRKELVCTEGI